ncbi:MAG TPA: hypothetical protein DCL38_01350 [Lachnospiraceae bacterium]|nr:hypothetical protein [Lachnospiraceae bacterium]
MSSGNLYKSNHYVVKTDDARVIDSNNLIADRMQKLSEILEMDGDEAFADDFSYGLNAEQVEALLGDEEPGEGEDFVSGIGNVIKDNTPKVDTEELLRQAQEEADRITAEAGAEAQRIIEEARGEAEGIKEQARNEGAGEGYQEGLQKAGAEFQVREQALKEEADRLREEYAQKYETMETELVRDLTDVFEHVLGVNLSDQTDIVLNLMKEAIKNIEGGKNFFVHVSPEDYAYVSAFKEDILNSVGGVDSVDIVEDVTLKQSDCFIECESGIYECGLGTELSLLKKELRLLSYTKE